VVIVSFCDNCAARKSSSWRCRGVDFKVRHVTTRRMWASAPRRSNRGRHLLLSSRHLLVHLRNLRTSHSLRTMRTSRIAQDTSRIVAASRAQRTASRTRSSANAAARPPSEEHDIYAPWESELVSDSADLRAGDKERATKRRKTGQGAPMAVKHEVGEISMAAIASPGKGSRPKKARRAPAKKTTVTKVGVQVEPPPHWETMYALTREMRKANLAPVDTMGCESLADKERTPRDQRFQTLIALMLSSQTKDTVTAVAMRGMQERMPGVHLPTPLQLCVLTIIRGSTSNPSSPSRLPH
jgi:hypothetical protein